MVVIFSLAQKLHMEMNRSIRVLDKLLSMEELVAVLGLCKLVQTQSGQFDVLLVELSSGIIPAPGLGYCNQMRCLLWMVLQDDPEIDLVILAQAALIKQEHFKCQAPIHKELIHLTDEHQVFLISG
jgi:hypothetical protein